MNDQPYYTFNREERNLAAILYHLLLTGEQNLGRFLDLVDHKPEWPLSKCEVYYEYAWIRDDWHRKELVLKPDVVKQNAEKRNWVVDRLPMGIKPPSSDNEIRAWNEFFGLVKNPSVEHIQSPANWVLSRVSDTVQGDDYCQLALLK